MKNNNNLKTDVFKSFLIEDSYLGNKYEMPFIYPTFFRPEKAIPFDKITKSKDFNQWVHFYIHDRKFECFWKNPHQYLKSLQKFEGVITPDFSVYTNMPKPMKIWNIYRNRALSVWLQKNNVNIIPNISWSTPDSYDYCFDGISIGSTIAVSTNGCIKDKIDREIFKDGLKELCIRLKPKTIINYSYAPKDIWDDYIDKYDIIFIENYHQTVRKGEASNR